MGSGEESKHFSKEDANARLKLRADLEARAARESVAAAHDEAIRELGFDEETVKLLDLIPLIEVAWADGTVEPAERELVRAILDKRGISPGSRAYLMADTLLEHRPSPQFFERALTLVRRIFDTLPPERRRRAEKDMVVFCVEVADASGGLLGIGRISKEERAELRKIIDGLSARHGERVADLIKGA